MGWSFPWSESIKKRASRYLLQHYVGSFLREKLTLDQLSVDIYNGTGSIQDVHLDVETINEALERIGAPLELVDGFVSKITVSIPWSSLLSRNSDLEISGLELTLKPNLRNGEKMDVSRLSTSMTSSLQLAQECLRSDAPSSGRNELPAAADAKGLPEGLEAFANTIDSVMTRIKVVLLNTVVRLEHVAGVSANSDSGGMALEIRVQRVEYFDDAASDAGAPASSPRGAANLASNMAANLAAAATAFAVKNVHVSGVSMLTDEFVSCHKFAATNTAASDAFDEGSLGSQYSGATTSSYQSATDFFTSARYSFSSDIVSRQPTYAPTLSSTKGGTSLLSGRGSSRQPWTDNSCFTTASKPVQFATCLGDHRVKVRVKLNEQVAGPKVNIELRLSSIGVFISPRQVHVLSALAGQFTAAPSGTQRCPMPEFEDWADAQRVPYVDGSAAYSSDVVSAEELHSVDILGDDFDRPQLQPLLLHIDPAALESQMFMSARKDNSDMDLSAWGSQTSASSQASDARGVSGPGAPSSCLSVLTLEVAFLLGILIHDDLPRSSGSLDDVSCDSGVDMLTTASKRFFSGLTGQRTKGVSDLSAIRGETIDYCPDDHLKFIAKSLRLEAKQQCALTDRRGSCTPACEDGVASSLTLSVSNCELTEWADSRPRVKGCEARPYHSELLVFSARETGFGGASDMTQSMYEAPSPSCVKVTLTTTAQRPRRPARSSGRHAGAGRTARAAVKLSIQLCRPLVVDVDVSLYDRLHNLLRPTLPTWFDGGSRGSERRPHSGETNEHGMAGADQTTLTVNSESHVIVIVRFPIADLRGRRDPNGDRLPWKWRHLRTEALHLHFTQPALRAVLSTSSVSSAPSTIDITFHDVVGSLLTGHDEKLTQILCAHQDYSLLGASAENSILPRLVITLKPPQAATSSLTLTTQVLPQVVRGSSGSSSSELPSLESLSDVLRFDTVSPSPFSEQKTLYNDTEAVLPGTKSELKKFATVYALSALSTSIDVLLPQLDVVLSDHDTLELLYNRVCNDLLLWEPLSPTPQDPPWDGWKPNSPVVDYYLNPAMAFIKDKFSPCTRRPLDINESFSEDNESSMASSSVYSSLPSDQKQSLKSEQAKIKAEASCKAAIRLAVGHGLVLVCHGETGVQNGGEQQQQKQPGRTNGGVQQSHQSFIDLSDCVIFVASEACDDPNLEYVSVQVNKCELYHTEVTSMQEPSLGTFDDAVSVIKKSCHPAVFLCDEPDIATALEVQVGKGSHSEDMLDIAVKIRLDPVRKMKDVLVALRASSAKVAPCSADPEILTRLRDFFDLVDQEVLGYAFPKVVTELHVHALSCMADIRLPTAKHRALLVVDKLDITSNVVANSPVSAMRFLVEDAALYLSPEMEQRTGSRDFTDEEDNAAAARAAVMSHPESVCVMDLGHFKLLLRTSDGRDLRYPKADVQAECNILHVRTCSDTCRALLNLVRCAATMAEDEQDDLVKTPVQSVEASVTTSVDTAMQDSDIEVTSVLPAEGAIPRVPVMLADAMDESLPQTDSLPSAVGRSPSASRSAGSAISYATATGDINLLQQQPFSLNEAFHNGNAGEDPASDESSSLGSDFCIVEDCRSSDEPHVELLGVKALRCQDDFFERPLVRADQLNAPPGLYPPVVAYRYTLQNLSVVWYMYGGEDFSWMPPPRERASDSSGKMGKVGRQARGGRGRDIDSLIEVQLTKLRMQHEVFCASAAVVAATAGTSSISPVHYSRSCVLLNDIEVRDRLLSSSIDKLLYIYTSEKLPKQSHANAILLKAVCLKPDLLPGSEEECNVRLSLQPLRLNIDQDAVTFLHAFFNKALEVAALQPQPPAVTLGGSLHVPPRMAAVNHELHFHPRSNAPGLSRVVFDEMGTSSTSTEVADSAGGRTSQLFIKNFVFTPDLHIRLDYIGKGVINGGSADSDLHPLVRLLAGLAHLSRVELRLKALHFKQGILGADRLLQECLKEWQRDLKLQLPMVLGGLGPASSVVQIFNGLHDLVWLPVEQYKKDGRIMFGLQRGMSAFGVSTAAAFLELTHVAMQSLMLGGELVFDLLSPAPITRSRLSNGKRKAKRQPADVRQGLANAAEIVTDGVYDATNRLVEIAMKEHADKGLRGAVGGVVREIPSRVVEPFILATKGISEVLQGTRNHLVPDAMREDCHKWRGQDGGVD